MTLHPPPLSRSAHHRAAERRDDAHWLAEAWAAGLVLAVSADSRVQVTRPEPDRVAIDYARSADFDPSAGLLLGELGDQAYFAVHLDDPAPTDGAGEWAGLRDVGADLSDLDAGLTTSAVALVQWHATHPRCPRCGATTEVINAGWSRRCPVDGSQHFPRTDPAVIMLVHDGGDRCVMGRQQVWPEGRFSVLAGFVEAGESAEAAVVREVAEEVGLAVTDVQYVSSQPWPFPSSLMLGYLARVEGDQTIERRDGELAEAGWFTKDDLRRAAIWGPGSTGSVVESIGDTPGPTLVALPGGISIARQLIDLWLDD